MGQVVELATQEVRARAPPPSIGRRGVLTGVAVSLYNRFCGCRGLAKLNEMDLTVVQVSEDQLQTLLCLSLNSQDP